MNRYVKRPFFAPQNVDNDRVAENQRFLRTEESITLELFQ